ncbi:hypothetical protein QQS21_005776 [Conoideocrella luteorostrata]|uniref:Uncharacterized protein n=1 Tax=Conoideocrella luteorostrata TaxID=1105319 RepID=A0AAJ0CT19_9HYPO|nr:hypothetical protein QQS21_005776 [Conoideocrella luteorostrata]
MDLEPPRRYANPHVIIHELDSDSESESSFRASDDSTLAESDSIPPSPRQPPAYADEGAPPQYQEEHNLDDVKARREAKKTLCIRLLTSVFITVLVSLIVAAVVARVHDSQINTNWSSNQAAPSRNHTANGTSFTMDSSKKSTSAKQVMVHTAPALHNVETAVVAQKAQPTATSQPSTMATTVNKVQAVDCASPELFANATLITDTTPAATGSTLSERTRRSRQSVEEAEDQVVGMSIYTLKGCLLARSAYKGTGIGDLVHRCTMMCPDKKLETNQARHVVTDEWGACG